MKLNNKIKRAIKTFNGDRLLIKTNNGVFTLTRVDSSNKLSKLSDKILKAKSKEEAIAIKNEIKRVLEESHKNLLDAYDKIKDAKSKEMKNEQEEARKEYDDIVAKSEKLLISLKNAFGNI